MPRLSAELTAKTCLGCAYCVHAHRQTCSARDTTLVDNLITRLYSRQLPATICMRMFQRCVELCGDEDNEDRAVCWCCICPCMTGAMVGMYALRIGMNLVWVSAFAVLLMLEGVIVCWIALCGSFLLLVDDEDDEGCCAGERTWCFCIEACCDGENEEEDGGKVSSAPLVNSLSRPKNTYYWHCTMFASLSSAAKCPPSLSLALSQTLTTCCLYCPPSNFK